MTARPSIVPEHDVPMVDREGAMIPEEKPLVVTKANGTHEGGFPVDSTPSSMPASAPAAPDSSTPNPPPSNAPPVSANEARPWPADCEDRRIFRAHGVSMPSDSSKYEVAADSQYAVMFYFDSPWADDVQMLAARPLVDNRKVVHHWVLWTLQKDRSRDGEVVGGPNQLHPDSEAVVAPLIAAGIGSTDLEMPNNVGIRVGTPDTVILGLEIHYVNLASDSVEETQAASKCV
jgi:hypothetical protein